MAEHAKQAIEEEDAAVRQWNTRLRSYVEAKGGLLEHKLNQ